MHDGFARYYDKLHHFKNYEEQTRLLVGMLRDAHPGATSLLEVACGTGLFTEHLATCYQVEGLDISEEMLAQARRKMPGLTFHHGDMQAFRLGRTFDVVACLFSSIAYARTEAALSQAIGTMARHVAPGGILVVEPFFSKETYWVDKVFMNTLDEEQLKISWIYVSGKLGDEACLDYHFTVGTPGGVEHFTERHVLGLFGAEDYARAFTSAGMTFRYDPQGHARRGLYIATARNP